jgi:hypothetical protein
VESGTILDVKSRILNGPGTQEIQTAVRAVLQGGDRKVLLNMGDVNIIDSECVGDLVSALVTAQNGGPVKVAQPHQERASGDEYDQVDVI